MLIIGGGEVGVETADFCSDYCTKVTVVEMRERIASEMAPFVVVSMLERFQQGGKIELLTGTRVVELTSDGAICESGGKTVTLSGYDSVILALGAQSYQPFDIDDSLAEQVFVVGDANKTRSATEAFFEAAKAAVSI